MGKRATEDTNDGQNQRSRETALPRLEVPSMGRELSVIAGTLPDSNGKNDHLSQAIDVA